jgi:hypothetical protein
MVVEVILLTDRAESSTSYKAISLSDLEWRRAKRKMIYTPVNLLTDSLSNE